MLVTLGLGTGTGLYSSITAVACDHIHLMNKTIITSLVLSIGFLVGIVFVTPGGQQILELVDFFNGNVVMFGLAILEVFGGKYTCLYGKHHLARY